MNQHYGPITKSDLLDGSGKKSLGSIGQPIKKGIPNLLVKKVSPFFYKTIV